MSKIYFISDLHLDGTHPLARQWFLKFLDQYAKHATALYILGDFFEVWIGDDDQAEWITEIKMALRQVVDSGLAIYFLPGNRDFLISQDFLNKTGLQLLPDEMVINLFNEKILLMHGDTLCTDDTGYVRARPFLRHPLLRKLFLYLPLTLRQHLAKQARAKSANYTAGADLKKLDAVSSAIDECLTAHQADYLIHGHTHKPGMHVINKNQRRIVLGAWHKRANALLIDANGHKDLIEFNF